MTKGTFGRPFACNIRIFATALESTLEHHMRGGTGYITADFKNHNDKMMYHGFDKNETGKLHCYYMTNKGFGSEFLDTPKTLSIAVYCPVSIDDEIGPFAFKNPMQSGYWCRLLSDTEAHLSMVLRPTTFSVPLDYAQSFPRYVCSVLFFYRTHDQSCKLTICSYKFHDQSYSPLNLILP